MQVLQRMAKYTGITSTSTASGGDSGVRWSARKYRLCLTASKS